MSVLEFPPFPCSLQTLPVLRRRHAQTFLHVATEVGQRRETVPVGNRLQRDVLARQQARDADDCEAVYPGICAEAADFLAYFGEVFGRDAEFRGIVGHLAVLFAGTLFQHVEELCKDDSALLAQSRRGVLLGVEVVKVEAEGFDEAAHQVAVESVPGLRQPSAAGARDSAAALFCLSRRSRSSACSSRHSHSAGRVLLPGSRQRSATLSPTRCA